MKQSFITRHDKKSKKFIKLACGEMIADLEVNLIFKFVHSWQKKLLKSPIY